MKLNELKIGDKIKFSCENSKTKNGSISQMTKDKLEVTVLTENLLWGSGLEWIRKDQVICKLEPIFKEIPVEQSMLPTSFPFKVHSVKIEQPIICELGRYAPVGCKTTIHGFYTGNGIVHLELPFKLEVDSTKSLKVTIEEIE